MSSARARVQITVEIEAGSSWGPDCTVGQIRKQAVDAVEQALRRGLTIGGLASPEVGRPTPAKIIGKPKVSMVVVEELP